MEAVTYEAFRATKERDEARKAARAAMTPEEREDLDRFLAGDDTSDAGG